MAVATARAMIRSAAELSGPQRGAVLLMYLDGATVQNVIGHLTTGELEAIGEAMASLSQVAPNVIEEVVREFVRDLRDVALIPESGREFALGTLPTLIDEHRRPGVLRKLRREVSTEFREFITSRPANTVATLLREEHPQTQAVALLLMGTENAGRVMACFDETERYDLTVRMTSVQRISNELAEDVEQALTVALSRGSHRWEPGGLDMAAQSLGYLGRKAQDALLGRIADTDAGLSDKLRRRMLPFEYLADLEDRSIQTLLRNIDRGVLTSALCGSEPRVRERFLANMSSRAAADLRDEMALLSPSPIEIRGAKEEIVQSALRLQEEGALRLGIGDEEGEE